MLTGTRTRYQNAIDKARRHGGARAAQPLGNGRYAVASASSAATYTVRILTRDGRLLDVRCTCPAGQKESPCWHAAAAWIRWTGEAAAQPVQPAARPRLSPELIEQWKRELWPHAYPAA